MSKLKSAAHNTVAGHRIPPLRLQRGTILSELRASEVTKTRTEFRSKPKCKFLTLTHIMDTSTVSYLLNTHNFATITVIRNTN